MELLHTEEFYILNKDQDSLWFNKKTGDLQCKTCWDIADAKNPVCLGIVHAVLGKIQILPDVSPRLILVTGVKEVGKLDDGPTSKPIYCITKVIFLPLTSTPDFELNLDVCRKHQIQYPNSANNDRRNILPFGDLQQKVALSKTFGTLKNVTSSIKTATVNVAANATGQGKAKREVREKEKFEKRIVEELSKMFNESESFYFSLEDDLTSSIQRQNDPSYDKNLSLWQRADDRFFWNKYMLDQFRADNEKVPESWLIPVIHGHFELQSVPVELGRGKSEASLSQEENGQSVNSSYSITLISRRSRWRAGTRYKRRGIDDDGHVANYVETEQIVRFSHHRVAFIQVRGSVPIYWSQPGYKYRPPPRLDRGEEETAVAFKKHFEREFENYGSVSCVSLVEQAGKEKVLADAFLNHVLSLDSPDLTYISFDFHEYCRGMRFENVSILIEGIEDVITAMSYCWVDKEGVICRQNGVFRTNCIDCLDRTNVIQTSLAKVALESQFVKLGIIPPEYPIPLDCRSKLQQMWANNGDALSKQYAGTSALKGDFTRTGERNFAGLMKDGMNSANRYYKNHFKDAYRQAALEVVLLGEVTLRSWIDVRALDDLAESADKIFGVNPPQYMSDIALGPEKELARATFSLSRYYLNRFRDAYRQASMDAMLGQPLPEDLMNLSPEGVTSEEDDASLAQHVKSVIDDCKILLVPDAQTILGAWGLIDADPVSGDAEQTDMDVILVLTRDSYYVAEYDEEADRISQFERVSLIDLDKIEVGPYTYQGMFKQARTHFCIRLHYQMEGQGGFFNMFRSMNIRFFNNLAVTIKTEEEIVESIKAIGDTFEVACEMIGCDVTSFSGKLEKIKGKSRITLSSPFHLFSPIASFTRTSPDVLKSAGTRAFTNVTSGLARLNPISNLKLKRHSISQTSAKTAQFYVQQPVISVDEASSNHCKRDMFIPSCGIVASSLDHPLQTKRPSFTLLSRSHSFCSIEPVHSQVHSSSLNQRSITPEILVTSGGTTTDPESSDLLPKFSNYLRKFSRSTEEVENKGNYNVGIPPSSSDYDLESGQREPGKFFSQMQSPLSPLSPLSHFNKETVLAPFSVLARGVQSLAPGAGKIAKGVQSIGANLDPRKLRILRQKQIEQDIELKERKNKCKSRIIQF